MNRIPRVTVRREAKRKKVIMFNKEPMKRKIFGVLWWDCGGNVMYPESEYGQAHRCVNGLKCRKPSRY